MNKIKSLLIGGAVLALSGAILVSAPMAAAPDGSSPGAKRSAQGWRMHGGFGGSAPLITIALNHKDELKLSSDQVANLEKIRTNYQNQVTPLHQQVRASEKEIANLTQQTPANLVLIKTKIQEGEKLRSELRYLRIEALENGRSVLSQQQIDQLKSLVQARREQFRGQRGQPS
jgi:Spy/CpxP family protein refolding chaperone